MAPTYSASPTPAAIRRSCRSKEMSPFHLRGIVEELLGDDLVAAPGLQRNFLHHLRWSPVLGEECETPVDCGAVAIDEDRAEPGGLDPGDGGEHCRLAAGKLVASLPRLVLVLPRGSIRRIEALDGADMVVGFDGRGESFDDMTVRHRATPFFDGTSIFIEQSSKVTLGRPPSGISTCKNAYIACLAGAGRGS